MSFVFSIVIICKDAAATIGHTLESTRGLSDDVVVYDSGSTDKTLDIISQHPVHLYHGTWNGFGPTRQKASMLAKYDWVLMIDADEVITDNLQKELQQLALPSPQTAYRLLLKHQIGPHLLYWGQWRNDYRIRLYHRKTLQWNDKLIHETIGAPGQLIVKDFKGYVNHFPASSIDAFGIKMKQYALLTAEQYRKEGKKASWLKRYISPCFNFVQNYFFKLGFLDGVAGFRLALIFSRYTYEKYRKLACAS